MKRRIAWLLVLIICLFLVACHGTKEPEPTTIQTTQASTEETTEATIHKESQVTPLLYRVTDDKGNVVWLFGSIHVGRADFYPLPDYVLEAFDGADALAVEVDIITFESSLKLQTQALTSLVYTDGTTIQEHISQELYEKSVKILKEQKSYMKPLERYCPSFWSSMIDSAMMQQLGAQIDLGIDRHLLERAKDTDKEILQIESALFQYQMLGGFSDELQELLLEASVENYENPELAKEDLNSLMDLWASGDQKAFSAYLSDDGEVLPEETHLYEEYNKAMLVDRNQSMTDFAETALQSDKEVFICVGAAHVVGEGGIAQLLDQRGYTVECIVECSQVE